MDEGSSEKKLRATKYRRVTRLRGKAGDILQPGQVFTPECKHPTVIKDLCAKCGADLRHEAESGTGKITNPATDASIPMVHSIPELKVCPALAEKIGKEDEHRLLQDKKLVLLVDLDQTMVHTTNENVPVNIKDVFHYQLYGPNSPWYHTRLRPGTRHFLSEMSRMYELHICTFGARNYAHTVAALLDKEGSLFSHRILSRDECFDPASKTANLKALFPCGDDMVCIIDDREDVWQGCGNLVQVKPYNYFRHTGDIHAPSGLDKKDQMETLETPMRNEETETEKCADAAQENKESVIVDNNDATMDNEKEYATNCDVVCEENEKSLENVEIVNVDASSTKKIVEKEMENEEEEGMKMGKENAEGTGDSIEKVNEEIEKLDTTTKDEETSREIFNNAVVREEKPDIEDHDDYLLYLEDILRRIHAEFYDQMDKGMGKKSLREIIPRVRARVLKGLCLTFSGLIPTHQKLHQSRAYKVAKALGAEVTQDLTEKTTHLVAIKPGTAKANIAKKNKSIKIVNSDWLWLSAERWEQVDERLFPLTAKARASRIPPPHCSSPERIEDSQNESNDNFADSINPLMSFTAEEIKNMDKEVDDDMSDQEMDFGGSASQEFGNNKRIYAENSDSDVSDDDTKPKVKRKKSSNESSTDDSSDAMDRYVSGHCHVDDDEDENDDDEDENEDGNDDDDDDPITRFRRGEDLPDDLDLGENSQDSIGDPPEDDPDDREWNALGAALEREFLTE